MTRHSELYPRRVMDVQSTRTVMNTMQLFTISRSFLPSRARNAKLRAVMRQVIGGHEDTGARKRNCLDRS